MNPPVKPQLGPVAEQLDVIDHRHIRLAVAILAAARAVDLHDVRQHVAGRSDSRPARAARGRTRAGSCRRSPSRTASRRVACRSDSLRAAEKSSHQGKWIQPAAKRLDDPRRFVDRAGVDDDHLVDPRPDALQAGRQRPGRVSIRILLSLLKASPVPRPSSDAEMEDRFTPSEWVIVIAYFRVRLLV